MPAPAHRRTHLCCLLASNGSRVEDKYTQAATRGIAGLLCLSAGKCDGGATDALSPIMRPRLPTLDYSEEALPLPLIRAAHRPSARALLDDAERQREGAWATYVTSAVLVLGASAAAVGAFVRWIAPIVVAHAGP
jgi:hypothetical protein